jgi:O-antigen/teichoic acid export membrane protein
MNIRQLLTASALYGVADMLVLAVGGFLLLPLYTRILSQAEFGTYVIIKANVEILTYLLYLGLLSAAARLYYDYRDLGRQREYLNSVLMFFLLVVLAAGAVLAFWGDAAWHLLSPTVTAQPYLWYCLALAAASFTAGLGSLWFRLDERVKAFVALQIAASALLAATVYINLVVLKLGLTGLLLALVIGYVPASVALFYCLGDKFRPVIRREHVTVSLHYGMSFAVSYIAYFILNRFSMLTLQHYVAVDQIAVFGLAQQLTMLVSILATSFGKAMQPAVYGAPPAQAPEILRRASKLFILLVFGIASLVVMFAHEIILVVATKNYLSGYEALLILLVGSFVYSLGWVSSTVLLYYRRPRVLAAATILGAVMSAVLSLLLIPRYHLMGGAVATFGACLAATLASYIMAYRVDRQSYFGQSAITLAAICLFAIVSAWLQRQDMGLFPTIGVKTVLTGIVFAGIYAIYAPKGFPRSWSELGAHLRTK